MSLSFFIYKYLKQRKEKKKKSKTLKRLLVNKDYILILKTRKRVQLLNNLIMKNLNESDILIIHLLN